nr:hypothetical transcript [Hymenolepis microstoma]
MMSGSGEKKIGCQSTTLEGGARNHSTDYTIYDSKRRDARFTGSSLLDEGGDHEGSNNPWVPSTDYIVYLSQAFTTTT